MSYDSNKSIKQIENTSSQMISQSEYIENNFVIFYKDKRYKFIAPKCYLSKITTKQNLNKPNMSILLNPNMKLKINSRGFLERVHDMSDYNDLPDAPYYFLNLSL